MKLYGLNIELHLFCLNFCHLISSCCQRQAVSDISVLSLYLDVNLECCDFSILSCWKYHCFIPVLCWTGQMLMILLESMDLGITVLEKTWEITPKLLVYVQHCCKICPLKLVRLCHSWSEPPRGIPSPSEVSPKPSSQRIYRSLPYLLLTLAP